MQITSIAQSGKNISYEAGFIPHMRVLILSQWYPPEPASLLQDLAYVLKAEGHEVMVLTGFPNYPSGKIYPGYRLRLHQREVLAGVQVVRVPLYPEHSRSGMRRALNYLSFALSSSLLGPWLFHRPDVIFAYHPPLTVGLPAFLLSCLWRVPFVYQIQDMWPETLRATGMLNNEQLLHWVGRFAQWVYKQAHAILVISPGFRRNLLSKGTPNEKIHVISNWVDPNSYHPLDPDPRLAEELGLARRFNVMFAGNIGEAQGLEAVVEAAGLLKDLPEVQFVFVGEGVALPRLRQAVKERQLANVIFLGRYPEEAMAGLYALANVLLVHLKDDPLFCITIPHKTLAYLGAGKPILVAVAGDVADMVTTLGAGLACPPEAPKALAETVRRFYTISPDELHVMGKCGQEAAQTRYSRDILVGKIEEILQQAVKQTQFRYLIYRNFGKRFFDLLLAIPTLVILAPVFVFVALLVRANLSAPVLFNQKRPGLQGKPFRLFKFRTMADIRNQHDQLLPNNQRLTTLGKFLRETSLDELPELFNVLKGDMSLVGPRPLLMEYLDRYSPEQARRHEVKPGITGWAQVNGRNAITWEQKFEHDVWYVDHQSFSLDLKIIALTIWKILKREGINQPGQATMEEFLGSNR